MRGIARNMQMTDQNSVFAKRYYLMLILGLFAIAVTFFTMAVLFNKDFFVNYSPDKTIKDSTLESINFIRIIFMIASTIFLMGLLGLVYQKEAVLNFLENHKKIILNITLLLGILLFLFLASEIFLRIKYHETTFSGGFGPGSLQFNKKYVEINDDGMRDRNFSLVKPNNVIRIATIGDSFTFGSGIKNVSRTYPKVLESELNNLGKDIKYEVMNFGIMGLSTNEEIELIKSKALKYSPDIIILGYVANDFVSVDGRKYKEHVTIFPGGLWIRNFLFSYAIFELKFNRILENLNLKDNNLEIYNQKLNSTVNLEYNRLLFKELKNIAIANNFSVLVVNFPAFYNLEEYPLLELNNFVEKSTTENELNYLDLLGPYSRFEESELIVNNYDSHPNEYALKIAVDEILEKLKNDNLV